jgi:hypothetical protein
MNYNSKIEKICIDGLSNAYIIENEYLEKILFNRGLIGLDFAKSCFAASCCFVNHFRDEFNDIDNIAELMILSKGFYYRLSDAFMEVLGKNLQINFIATKRKKVDADKASIEIPYSDLSVKADTLIIGDTVASGSTICAAIDFYTQTNNCSRVFIYSIAGSLVGGKVISQFCHKKGIELHIIYSLALFGLAENGFDLSFLHPDTITKNIYKERGLNAFEGKPISAVGLDFGSQSQSLKKYKNLCYLEKKYWNVNEEVFPETDENIDNDLVKKECHALTKR